LAQYPLPPAQSVQDTLAPSQADQNRLAITRRYSGWYPRWWLLSAIFCTLLIGTLRLIKYLTCTSTQSTALLCQIDSWTNWTNWTDWRQEIVVGIIWLIFLLGWLFAFKLGVGPIEIAKQRSPITKFFRAISQFETIYLLLLVYGIIALACILIICGFGKFNPIVFSLASIVVFIANCSFLYKRSLEGRHLFIITYAALAFICLGVMFLSGRFQLTIALMLIGSGLWSLVRGFLWRNQTRNNPTAVPATPEDPLVQAISKTPTVRLTTPDAIPNAPTTQARMAKQPTQPLDNS